jgi:hypothetical protein
MGHYDLPLVRLVSYRCDFAVNTSVEKRAQFNRPFIKCQQLSVLPSRWASRGGLDFALKRGVDNSDPTVYLRHRRRQKRFGLNKISPIRSRPGDLLSRATCRAARDRRLRKEKLEFGLRKRRSHQKAVTVRASTLFAPSREQATRAQPMSQPLNFF